MVVDDGVGRVRRNSGAICRCASAEVYIYQEVGSLYLGSESRFVTMIRTANMERRRRGRYTKPCFVVDYGSVESEVLNMREGIGCNIRVDYGDFVDPVDDRGWCGQGLEVELGDDTDAIPISEENIDRQII